MGPALHAWALHDPSISACGFPSSNLVLDPENVAGQAGRPSCREYRGVLVSEQVTVLSPTSMPRDCGFILPRTAAGQREERRARG